MRAKERAEKIAKAEKKKEEMMSMRKTASVRAKPKDRSLVKSIAVGSKLEVPAAPVEPEFLFPGELAAKTGGAGDDAPMAMSTNPLMMKPPPKKKKPAEGGDATAPATARRSKKAPGVGGAGKEKKLRQSKVAGAGRLQQPPPPPPPPS